MKGAIILPLLSTLASIPVAGAVGVAATDAPGEWLLLHEPGGERAYRLVPGTDVPLEVEVEGVRPFATLASEGERIVLPANEEGLRLRVSAAEPGGLLLVVPEDPAEAGVAVGAGRPPAPDARRVPFLPVPLLLSGLAVAFLAPRRGNLP